MTDVTAKPSWANAPPWANWLAMDANGAWYWYENKPIIEECDSADGWFPAVVVDGVVSLDDVGLCALANEFDWKDSLEGRPDAE